MSKWADYLKDGMPEDDLVTELITLPEDLHGFIDLEIMPLLRSGKKVSAIKAFREESGASIRLAKTVLDALDAKGLPKEPVRRISAELLDMIELTSNYCRKALRASTDDKATAMLLGIRQQLDDLWEELFDIH